MKLIKKIIFVLLSFFTINVNAEVLTGIHDNVMLPSKSEIEKIDLTQYFSTNENKNKEAALYISNQFHGGQGKENRKFVFVQQTGKSRLWSASH